MNCNVEFAADGVAVDHFGNVPGDYESEGSDRSNFWLPVGPLPCAASAAGMDSWVQKVAAKQRL